MISLQFNVEYMVDIKIDEKNLFIFFTLFWNIMRGIMNSRGGDCEKENFLSMFSFAFYDELSRSKKLWKEWTLNGSVLPNLLLNSSLFERKHAN